MTVEPTRIGDRVAALRKARGYTQRGLAQRAAVSYSLLTKVETGHAPATPVFVGAVARALRVDVPAVTGQPFMPDPAGDRRVYDHVVQIRRALLAYDLAAAVEPEAPPRPLDEIAGDVRRASDLRRRTQFGKLAAMLPPLLDELTFVATTGTDGPREQAFALLAEAYYAVECLASGRGFADVYVLAIERLTWAAEQSGDPLLIAAAKWGRAGPLMRDGAYRQGLALLETARADVDTATTDGLAVLGSLHLRSSLLAARANRPDDAWSHLDEAGDLAARTGETNAYELSFGAANVTMHGITAAVEMADHTRALDIGAAAGPLDAPAERVGHAYIDLARAHVMQGDPHGALRALQRARHVAPQQTRHHTMTREIALQIAAGGRGSDELTRFMSWLGIAN